MHTPNYFPTKEAAEQYGLSASWLAKLRVFGGGPSFLKVGRRVLYERAAFEEWLASHRCTSTSDASQMQQQAQR